MEPVKEMEARVGFWPRLAAYLLDMLAVSTVALVLQRPLAGMFPDAVAAMIQDQTARAGAEAMGPFLEWAARLGVATSLVAPFYGLIEAVRGWSPGKLLLGLRIVTDQGQKPSLQTLLVRFGIKGSAALFAFVAVVSGMHGLNVLSQAAGWATTVGCLLVMSPARTAIHDRVAGTAVMRKTDLTFTARADSPTTSS